MSAPVILRLCSAVGLGFLLISAIACGSEEEAETASSSDGRGYSPNLEKVELSARQTEQLVKASAFQAALSSDGILTFAEYEAAALQLIACWEGLSYAPVHGLRLTAYGTLDRGVSNWFPGSPGATPPTDLNESVAACDGEFFVPLNDIWSRAKLSEPPPQWLFDEAREVLWACVQAEGFDLKGEPPGVETFRAMLQTDQLTADDFNIFTSCQEEVFDATGLPNWVG